jgi:hypothetical protein
MYRYVSSQYASKYIAPPPKHRKLSNLDVPESELEMRDVFNNWFVEGVVPIITSDSLYIVPIDQIQFDKFSQVVGMLLKNKDYYFAAKRILSSWERDRFETVYIKYLLLCSEPAGFVANLESLSSD